VRREWSHRLVATALVDRAGYRDRRHPAASVPEDRTGEVDQRLLVLAALDRLTARERSVIVLRYYMG
jgi:DNA-directed RNA polymerase specialized sigma24 family protein